MKINETGRNLEISKTDEKKWKWMEPGNLKIDEKKWKQMEPGNLKIDRKNWNWKDRAEMKNTPYTKKEK